MGKRRKTAKTGDKALYKARQTRDGVDRATKNSDDDPMYDKTDLFHRNREEEFLKLVGPGEESSDDQEEAVLDLGAGGDTSSVDSEDDEDGDELEGIPHKAADQDGLLSASESENELSESSDDDDEVDGDVKNWGNRKSAYYHGDTADLEIGQDEEDAYEEEEAAKDVLAARYKDVVEDDFVLSDDEDDEKKQFEATKLTALRDASKLSIREKRKLLDTQHPEMLPVLSYFSNVVTNLEDHTMVATDALLNGEKGTAEAVGATKLGQQYLLTKALLQSSTALNLATYLLLKKDQMSLEDVDSTLIQSHPVMARLQKWTAIAKKLEANVETLIAELPDQLSNLVKAAKLMHADAGNDADTSEGVKADDDGTDVDDIIEDAAFEVSSVSEAVNIEELNKRSPEKESEKPKRARNVVDEARFGLRANELAAIPSTRQRRPIPTDFGDEDDDMIDKAASTNLAATLNSIEQRLTTKKRKSVPMADEVDESPEDIELRQGLEDMEAELGQYSDDELVEGANIADEDIPDEKGHSKMSEGFYAKAAEKSNSKKARKKEKYQVAPKYPRLEPIVEGERAISRTILKNRGLVAHKSKLNRNPRVKKREQYRKALIRRKGAVREVRTDEGHKYGGEETGIKSNLTRSRKLV